MKINGLKKHMLVFCAAFQILSSAADTALADARNIIMLIADGTSAEQYTVARWFKGQPLALEEYRCGAVRTCISDSAIADSAPAATAYATGFQTCDKFLSVSPDSEKYAINAQSRTASERSLRPLATILEGARLQGRATGIVVTCHFTHATPAAFFSHAVDREDKDDIAEQCVYSGIDLVFAGGRKFLLPISAGGTRKDGADLLAVLRAKGYEMAGTRDEMERLGSPRAWGLFADYDMAPEIDRRAVAPQEPSLAEMTSKAISLLSGNPKGFFLMVEGSQIDWACHANDPSQMVHDIVAYDDAVRVALDFAKKDGKTLVIILSDHGNGGFSIGNSSTDKSYSQLKADALVGPLKKMKASAKYIAEKIGKDRSPANIKSAAYEYWGMEISDDEVSKIAALMEKYAKEPHYALGEVLCPSHTVFGWTTHGHTGGDVPLAAFGPDAPTGTLDAADVGKTCMKAFNINPIELEARLFTEAGKVFEGFPASVSSSANPSLAKSLIIDFGGDKAEVRFNRNTVTSGGKEFEMEGVAIHMDGTGKSYLPMQAAEILKNRSK